MKFNALDNTFIVAEIGVNHEGDEAVAADLIRKAAAAGADAVKFQTYSAEHYVSTEQPDRLARVRRFELSRDAFRRLAGVARESGILFFSTPLGLHDVDFLDEIAPIFKVSSGDLTFLALIRKIASKGKPTIISTGLGLESEIEAAVNAFVDEQPDAKEKGNLLLMHCVAAYPTPPAEANLRNICWLQERFGVPVGYSDHTIGSKTCELAVCVGAVAVEKHFTWRKTDQAFHDHALSADPSDLKEMVEAIRLAEVYLGSPRRQRTDSEIKGLAHMRRSIGTTIDVDAGVPIQREWLTWLRPAWGLGPESFDQIIGKRLRHPIAKGHLIRAEDLEADTDGRPA